jgi:hypothetical protein
VLMRLNYVFKGAQRFNLHTFVEEGLEVLEVLPLDFFFALFFAGTSSSSGSSTSSMVATLRPRTLDCVGANPAIAWRRGIIM